MVTSIWAGLLALTIARTFPAPQDVRQPDRTIAEQGPVALIAYDPEGRTIAAAGPDRVVRLWTARTGENDTGALIRSFEGHGARIIALGFTQPATLVSISEDRAIKTWDPATGKALGSTTLPEGVGQPIVRPGKDPWIAGVAGTAVSLYRSDSGALVKTFDRPEPRVRALAFAPDGKTLAVAGEATIRLWDVATGLLSHTIEAVAGVRSLALTAEHVAAGLADGTVKLWTVEGHEPLRSFRAHRGAVNAVAFGNKGAELATAGADRALEVWDVATGVRLCSQRGHTGAVLAVAFSPNGQKMASGGADRSLRYWTVPLPLLAPADLEKIAAAVPARARVAPRRPRKLLVFWRADAILHKGGVPAANKAIELLGKKTGAFVAHFSRDLEILDRKVLARYDALVLNSTAHLVIPDEAKKQALLDYVKGGGGVVGIHAAIDMFKSWPEGAEIVGATFGGHPWHPSGTWAVKLEQPEHPLLRAWGGQGFKMHDEFYELAEPYRRSDRRVLMSLDLSDAGTAAVTPLHRADKDFAVSWIKSAGKGRVFYCMFGHLADPFWNPAVLQYYLDGIQYALGDLTVE